jgi:adenylate cyclase
MAVLKATYKDPKDPDNARVVWINELPEGQWLTLGRVGKSTHSKDDNWSDWFVQDDDYISRRHAEIRLNKDKLEVRPRKGQPPNNPIKFDRHPVSSLILDLGGKFSIGNTEFQFLRSTHAARLTDVSDQLPILRKTLENQSLPPLSLADSTWTELQDSNQLTLLQEMQQHFAEIETLEEMEKYILESIMTAVPRADVVAIVAIASNSSRDNISVMIRNEPNYRYATPTNFRPSRRLVYHAVLEERKTVLYVLSDFNSPEADQFTSIPNTDWAICAPIFEREGFGWALYLSGRVDRIVSSQQELKTDRDLRKAHLFVMVVAQLFGLQSKMRDLEREVMLVRRFLPSKIINQIDPGKLEAILKPAKTQVAALFCDLRGASNHAERGIDNLIETWMQINSALVVMTESIDKHQGVIADLQGDAALGFWGWPPVPHTEEILSGPEHPIEQSAEAACEIVRRFPDQSEESGTGEQTRFRCGIGLAYGPAVAGRLGTPQQYKIDVFGPVVNLASRLEGLTKKLEVSILIDDAIAAHLLKHSSRFQIRRLFRVIPAGMGVKVTLHELLPTIMQSSSRAWEALDLPWHQAVHFLESGDWSEARPRFKVLSKSIDFGGPARFLLNFMTALQDSPPKGWDGTLRLESK